MRTPPFLVGAALVFWGWQTDFLPLSIVMAAVLEASRMTRARWEFSDEDFSRIWTICTLLFLGIAVYAFTDNGGPARFGSFFQNPSPATQSSAGAVTSRTASTMLRWLPMVLFLFIAAQAYSTREDIPLSTISLILRRRWKRAAKEGVPLPGIRGVNVAFPYFAVCLFAASVHPADGQGYFWGFCALVTWALWSNRTRRFGVFVWAAVLGVAFVGGFFGQYGVGRLQNYIQNLDPRWFERFARNQGTDPSHSRTQIGRLGQIKQSGKIVIRVEPKEGVPPDYLREASYRIYGERYWRAGPSRESFQVVPQETNNLAFILIGKTNFSSAQITCYLEGFSRESGVPLGLLPLPSGSGRLEELPVFVLRMNNLGAVLAEGPGLVTFKAQFGPGLTADSAFDPSETISITNFPGRRARQNTQGRPPVVANPDLIVDPAERPALSQVISNLNLAPGNRVAALRTLKSFFETNFTYSTWLETPNLSNTNLTPLGAFLTRTRRGHCEYFATATVLLLRELGIPARYAVGYAVHEKSGREYVVRLRDAHAWCLVWNERLNIWQDFDTTPASWIEEESRNGSPFQKLSDLWTWAGFQFAKFRWGQSNFRQYMLLALIPATLLLGYQIFARRKRKRNRSTESELERIWPGIDSEFYKIEQKLAARGIGRRTNEPLMNWFERAVSDPDVATAAESLREILRLHYQYRFDPNGLTASERERLRFAVENCLKELNRQPTKQAAQR